MPPHLEIIIVKSCPSCSESKLLMRNHQTFVEKINKSSKVVLIPFALRMAETPMSFGNSECKSIKMSEMINKCLWFNSLLNTPNLTSGALRWLSSNATLRY